MRNLGERTRAVWFRGSSVGQLMFVPGIVLLGWLLRTHLAVAIILYAYSSFFFTFPRPGLTTYTVELASQRTGTRRRRERTRACAVV